MRSAAPFLAFAILVAAGFASAQDAPNTEAVENDGDTLIDRGEQHARARWDDLIALKEKIGIPQDFRPEEKPLAKDPISGCDESFYIRSIRFEGIDPRDENWLSKLSRLKENSYITVMELKKAMDIVIGTDLYANVSYKLSGNNQDELTLTVERKAMSSLNLGLRFDNEEIMAVLLLPLP